LNIFQSIDIIEKIYICEVIILEEVLKQIATALEKDLWDYIGIFAPIILSVIAIGISMWNSFWSRNIKKLEANMVWDDLHCSFFIIIRNTGNKTIVIKSVSLTAYDKKTKELYELGTRDNAWAIKQEKAFIEANEAITISPIYGSIYDVFAYQGHAFDVTNENKDLNVVISVTDIDNHTWKNKTSFTLGKIDEYLSCAVTVE